MGINSEPNDNYFLGDAVERLAEYYAGEQGELADLLRSIYCGDMADAYRRLSRNIDGEIAKLRREYNNALTP